MISYQKLWKLLEQKSMTKISLRSNGIVIGQSYYNLTKGRSITFETLNKICKYLDCQPGDILEYVPDDENQK